MATAAEYVQFIKNVSREGLLKLWEECVHDKYDKDFWNDGKLLEYIVLHGFELERNDCVTYPYDVIDPDLEYKKPIEQIDGAIHVDELHALVECKDYDHAKIKVEPLTKMRNQLTRRHGAVFGMFFSITDFTTPTLIQVKYMAPQMIILWSKQDIEHCIKTGHFIDCMRAKYRMAVEYCKYKYDFFVDDGEIEKYLGEPFFK